MDAKFAIHRKVWQQVDAKTQATREGEWLSGLKSYRTAMPVKEWKTFRKLHCPPITEASGKLTRSQVLWNERQKHKDSGFVSNVTDDVLHTHRADVTQYSFEIENHTPRVPTRPQSMRPVQHEETLSLGRNPVLRGHQPQLVRPKEISSGYNPVTHQYRSEVAYDPNCVKVEAEETRARFQQYQKLLDHERAKSEEYRVPDKVAKSEPVPQRCAMKPSYKPGAATAHFENERFARTSLYLPSGRRLTVRHQATAAERTFKNDTFGKVMNETGVASSFGVWDAIAEKEVKTCHTSKRLAKSNHFGSEKIQQCLTMQVPVQNIKYVTTQSQNVVQPQLSLRQHASSQIFF